MGSRDPRIDADIARAAPFAQPILEHVREAVHEACPQVEKTMKWSSPSFVHAGGVLAGMAAFKRHASFGFRKHALVMGAGAPASGQGAPRERMDSYGKLASLADLPPKRRLIADIERAMALNEAGAKTTGVRKASVPKPPPPGPARPAGGAGRIRRLPAQRPARLRRMDRRSPASGHPRQTRGAGGPMAGRGQAPALEIRALLTSGALRP